MSFIRHCTSTIEVTGVERAMSGTLFVVATPIGNLEDLSPRARQSLAEVDLIAAEDTRRTGRLLSHIGVKTRQFAFHDHNEEQATPTLIEQLKSGKSVALVSDAGTPLLSDPGYRLVKAAHDASIPVSAIPGPSSLTAALSIAGLPTDRFHFEGFLPAKAVARRSRLRELAGRSATLVFFESVHRVRASVADMANAFGADRQACLARELTKLHEQSVRATLGVLLAGIDAGDIPRKGEFVIIVDGSGDAAPSQTDKGRLLDALADALPAKQAAAIAAQVTGEKKNALYREIIERRD
jgi:16S rRNA (cytidine1402-2'-O)-methyltransferase